MSEYRLELKQIVEHPRCRVYRPFIQYLVTDRNIRTDGGSGLFYYSVLCCYTTSRPLTRRVDGINYFLSPGEWLCTVEELAKLLRVRKGQTAIDILVDLETRHLLTFGILGHGTMVKYTIADWNRSNGVAEHDAPCRRDPNFFHIPVRVISDIVGTDRPSEMDMLLDLWYHAVHLDERVAESMRGPVVYMRNGTGKPAISNEFLAERWRLSEAQVGRFLKKLERMEYISLTTVSDISGSVIHLQKKLNHMFRVSDVLLDKEELVMTIPINMELQGLGARGPLCVSRATVRQIMPTIETLLTAQGFPCFGCRCFRYKLLRLSGSDEPVIDRDGNPRPIVRRYRLLLCCGEDKQTAAFEFTISPLL